MIITMSYCYLQTGVAGAVCVLDDEPTISGRHYGQIDPSICQTKKVSFSTAVMIQPESGPVCLLGTEFQQKICWEILVAGSEQGIEAGQVGLRLITKGERQTTVAKEWSISATSIADGRFVIFLSNKTMTRKIWSDLDIILLSPPFLIIIWRHTAAISWKYQSPIILIPLSMLLFVAIHSSQTFNFSCRWHMVTMTIDVDLGEATCYLDGGFDGYQTGLPLQVGNSIWEQGTEVWIGIRPPIDMDAFGRSDSEGAESKMHLMDVFLWGRCLTEDEIAALHTATASAEFSMSDFPEDNWQWADSPVRVCALC